MHILIGLILVIVILYILTATAWGRKLALVLLVLVGLGGLWAVVAAVQDDAIMAQTHAVSDPCAEVLPPAPNPPDAELRAGQILYYNTIHAGCPKK